MLSRHTIQSKHQRAKPPQIRTSCHLARILVGLDSSPESRNALRYASALARQVGAALTLLHVVEPVVCEADFGYGCVTRRSPNQDLLKVSLARLKSIARRLARSRTRPLAFVRTGTAGTEIAQAASDLAADLIVIGSHGHSRGGAPTGNVAERVVRDAPCPVLVVCRKQSQPVHPSKGDLAK